MSKQNLDYSFLPSSKSGGTTTKTSAKTSNLDYSFLPSGTKTTTKVTAKPKNVSNKPPKIKGTLDKIALSAMGYVNSAMFDTAKGRSSLLKHYEKKYGKGIYNTKYFKRGEYAGFTAPILGQEALLTKGIAKLPKLARYLGKEAPKFIKPITRVGEIGVKKAVKEQGVKLTAKEIANLSKSAVKYAAKQVPQAATKGALEGATQGALYSTGQGVTNVVTGDMTPSQALKNVAINTALGAGAGGLLGAAGKFAGAGIKAARTKAIPTVKEPVTFGDNVLNNTIKGERQGRNGSIKIQTIKGEPKVFVPKKPTTREAMQSLSYATGKGKLPEPMLALPPGPKPQAIKAVRDVVVPNKYASKWDTLVKEAERLGIANKPGRNFENWNSLWSQIADRTDPSLMELVGLANKPSTRNLVSLKNQGFTRTAKQLKGSVNRGFERARTIRQNPEMFGGFANPFIRTAEKQPRQVYNPIDAVETTVRNKQALKNKLGLTQSPAVKSEKVTVPTAKEPVMNISAEKQPGLVRIKQLKKEQITQSSLRKMKLKNGVSNKPRPYQASFEEVTSHTKKQVVPLSQKPNTTYMGNVDKFVTRFFNQNNPLKFVDKYMKKKGVIQNVTQKLFDAAQLKARARVIAAQFLEHGTTDINARKVGKSLKNILRGMDEKKTSDFLDYMLHRRNMTRAAKGEQIFEELNGVRISADESKSIVAEYEKRFPEFKQKAKELHEYDDSLLDYMVDKGAFDEAMVERIRTAEPDYIENLRQSRGLKKFNKVERKGLGSGEKIYNPFQAKIKKTVNMIDFAHQNELNLTLLRNIEANPKEMKVFAEVLPSSNAVKGQMVEQINRILENGSGYDDLSKAIDDGISLLEKTKHKGDIITVLDKGKPVRILIHDSELYNALKPRLPQERNFIVNMFAKASKSFKTVITGNPIWATTVGLPMDVATAYIRGAEKNPIRFTKELGLAALDVFRGDKSAAYTLFKNSGAGMQGLTGSDMDIVAQAMRDISGAKGFSQKLLKGVDLMHESVNRLEDISRLMTFKREFGKVEKGYFDNLVKNGVFDMETLSKAINNANDITLNFGNSGTVARHIEAFLPYFRVSMNGLESLVRTGKENPAAIAKAFSAISVPTVFFYAINHNNKDYQNLNQEVKDKNFLIPMSDGTFFKIPIPREYAVIFKAPVERGLKMVYEKDPKAFKGYANEVMSTIFPPGASQLGESLTGGKQFVPTQGTIIQPLIDVAMNKNYYGGNIVPTNTLRGSARYQETGKETNVARFIGDKLNFSPAKIDYLIKSYGGSYSKFLMPMNKDSEGIGKALLGTVVVKSSGYSDDITKFFDIKKKYDEQATNARNGKPVKPFYNPMKQRIMNRFSRRMSELYALRRATENNSKLSKDEKQIEMKKIQEDISTVAKQAVEYFKNK